MMMNKIEPRNSKFVELLTLEQEWGKKKTHLYSKPQSPNLESGGKKGGGKVMGEVASK